MQMSDVGIFISEAHGGVNCLQQFLQRWTAAAMLVVCIEGLLLHLNTDGSSTSSNSLICLHDLPYGMCYVVIITLAAQK